MLSSIGLLFGKKEAYIIIIIILFGIGNSPIYLSLSHLGDARPFGHGEAYCPVPAFYSKTKIVALCANPRTPSAILPYSFLEKEMREKRNGKSLAFLCTLAFEQVLCSPLGQHFF